MEYRKMMMPAILVIGALVFAGVLLLLVPPSSTMETAGGGDQSPATAKEGDHGKREVAAFKDDGDYGVPMEPASSAIADTGASEVAEDMEEPVAAEEASWEAPINAILESTEDNDTVAAKLDALAPTLPLDGQVEATQHMVNLLGDENYQIALRKLVNMATPPDVMEVIYSDVLNRPNAVKLPVLVNVLTIPGHPLRAESLETLQIFVGRDLGNDTQAWSGAVQEFLRIEAQEDAEFTDQ